MNKDKHKTALYQASMHACFLMLEQHCTHQERMDFIDEYIDKIISEYDEEEKPTIVTPSNNTL
jgi:hypothetical protein